MLFPPKGISRLCCERLFSMNLKKASYSSTERSARRNCHFHWVWRLLCVPFGAEQKISVNGKSEKQLLTSLFPPSPTLPHLLSPIVPSSHQASSLLPPPICASHPRSLPMSCQEAIRVKVRVAPLSKVMLFLDSFLGCKVGYFRQLSSSVLWWDLLLCICSFNVQC